MSEKALFRAVIGRDHDPKGSVKRSVKDPAVVDDFGIGRILHKTPGEGMVAIMYLRGALESVLEQT
ncbi:hypothetical protein ABIB90_000006 [Bradyrhizobium sp. JR4.1]|uniref:hypothetical protein n=1 Tax=Bradyrhizobium sp. JR4.1 TaxID=3156372 RepID=UPI003395EC70